LVTTRYWPSGERATPPGWDGTLIELRKELSEVDMTSIRLAVKFAM
jgi:hypothetical protein